MDHLPDFSMIPSDRAARLPEDKLLASLGSSSGGLSETEAEERLKKYGMNVIREERRIHILIEFLTTFRNPLIIILLCVSGISFLLRETVNAVMTAIMVLLSVTLNFFQEYKASKAAKKLKEKVAAHAVVIRNGTRSTVKTSHIAPGDVVELNAGDLVPADGRVLTAKDFFVNQSVLTGESFPVEKSAVAVGDIQSDPEDAPTIVFGGTSVLTGTATVVIFATGASTQFGRLAKSLEEPEEENDFTRGIYRFSVLILRVVLFFVAFIFLVNAFLKHDILDAFIFSIAVAVGLTPEFLPMIMTVTMGRGSALMAKKGVIVKKLNAIPSFGSMKVLCTDKTGTLTEAKIKLIKYLDLAGGHSETVFENAYLNSYFQTGISNPMDDAVLAYKPFDTKPYEKIDEIPFDFQRKKMSIIVRKQKSTVLIAKGAPEDMLESSTGYEKNGRSVEFTETSRKAYIKLYRELSQDGFRVLAVAQKSVDGKQHPYSKSDEKNLMFIGFVAFLDPPKAGTHEIIHELETMGIDMKVITGDNELVTEKICREVGIESKGTLLGHTIAQMSDLTLRRKVMTHTIFARCSPEEKRRIIVAVRKNGIAVGYLGDGINDAASLKAADVGISVSNATDVAKDSADIILTHKSLHELVDGVAEGRKTFGNTLKYILMGLSSNFGNMFSVLGAVLFLPFLPMLPVQILFNNFLYDLSQLTIPTDAVDIQYIRTPKRWDMTFIRKFMFVFGPISSLFDFITYGTMFLLFKSNPAAFQTGWFMESLATQTLVIHVIRTRLSPFYRSHASRYLFLSTLLSVTVGWLTPYTPIGKLLGFYPLPLPVVMFLGLLVLVYIFTAEAGKRFFYKHLTSNV